MDFLKNFKGNVYPDLGWQFVIKKLANAWSFNLYIVSKTANIRQTLLEYVKPQLNTLSAQGLIQYSQSNYAIKVKEPPKNFINKYFPGAEAGSFYSDIEVRDFSPILQDLLKELGYNSNIPPLIQLLDSLFRMKPEIKQTKGAKDWTTSFRGRFMWHQAPTFAIFKLLDENEFKTQTPPPPGKDFTFNAQGQMKSNYRWDFAKFQEMLSGAIKPSTLTGVVKILQAHIYDGEAEASGETLISTPEFQELKRQFDNAKVFQTKLTSAVFTISYSPFYYTDLPIWTVGIQFKRNLIRLFKNMFLSYRNNEIEKINHETRKFKTLNDLKNDLPKMTQIGVGVRDSLTLKDSFAAWVYNCWRAKSERKGLVGPYGDYSETSKYLENIGHAYFDAALKNESLPMNIEAKILKDEILSKLLQPLEGISDETRQDISTFGEFGFFENFVIQRFEQFVVGN